LGTTSKFLQTIRHRTVAAALVVFCAAGIEMGVGEKGKAAPPPLQIRTASLPEASVNLIYSETLQAEGGENPYQWKLTAGQLPKALTLGRSGALEGTPIDSGTFPITVTVSDTGVPIQTVQKNFSLTVATLNRLQLSTPALPGAKLSTPYSATLAASGGVAPYKWSALSGNLPPTLQVAPNGTITGTVAQPGLYRIVLEVRDSGNPWQTVQKSLSLMVDRSAATAEPPPPPYRTGALGPPPPSPQATSSPASPYPLAAVPGPNQTRSDPSSPHGRPATPEDASGTYRFQIVTTRLPPGQQNVMYSSSLAAAGGSTPYRWTLFSNQLPPGIRLTPGGAITGTPITAGVYSFTLRVTDSSASPITASQQFQLTIEPSSSGGMSGGAGGGSAPNAGNADGPGQHGPPLQLQATALPDGQVNQAYSAAVTVSGGLRPYAWALSAGEMPAGLMIDPARGKIEGAPASTGTFSFVIEVSDSSSPGQIVKQSYSIVITAVGAGSP
jgi:hypothetical protein